MRLSVVLNRIIEVFCVYERSSIPILVGLERNSRNDCVRIATVVLQENPLQMVAKDTHMYSHVLCL